MGRTLGRLLLVLTICASGLLADGSGSEAAAAPRTRGVTWRVDAPTLDLVECGKQSFATERDVEGNDSLFLVKVCPGADSLRIEGTVTPDQTVVGSAKLLAQTATAARIL